MPEPKTASSPREPLEMTLRLLGELRLIVEILHDFVYQHPPYELVAVQHHEPYQEFLMVPNSRHRIWLQHHIPHIDLKMLAKNSLGLYRILGYSCSIDTHYIGSPQFGSDFRLCSQASGRLAGRNRAEDGPRPLRGELLWWRQLLGALLGSYKPLEPRI